MESRVGNNDIGNEFLQGIENSYYLKDIITAGDESVVSAITGIRNEWKLREFIPF